MDAGCWPARLPDPFPLRWEPLNPPQQWHMSEYWYDEPRSAAGSPLWWVLHREPDGLWCADLWTSSPPYVDDDLVFSVRDATLSSSVNGYWATNRMAQLACEIVTVVQCQVPQPVVATRWPDGVEVLGADQLRSNAVCRKYHGLPRTVSAGEQCLTG